MPSWGIDHSNVDLPHKRIDDGLIWLETTFEYFVKGEEELISYTGTLLVKAKDGPWSSEYTVIDM